jgi:hypothetical protein
MTPAGRSTALSDGRGSGQGICGDARPLPSDCRASLPPAISHRPFHGGSHGRRLSANRRLAMTLACAASGWAGLSRRLELSGTIREGTCSTGVCCSRDQASPKTARSAGMWVTSSVASSRRSITLESGARAELARGARPRPAAVRAVRAAIAALPYALGSPPGVGLDRAARARLRPDGPPAAGGTVAATAVVRRLAAIICFVSAMKASMRRNQARDSRP